MQEIPQLKISTTVEVWEWIDNFIAHLAMYVITYDFIPRVDIFNPWFRISQSDIYATLQYNDRQL